jgi:hypothetical protein
MKQRISILIGVIAVALVAVSAAFAGSVTATATVAAGNSGNLALSLPSNPTISNTLDGSDQTATYTLPLSLNDVRGSGAGWNLTITSTTFSTGTHTFPTNASTITGVAASCNSGSTCTVPSNDVSNGSLAVPAGSTSPSAVKFENAGTKSGLGEINLTATVAVAIPANVFAGTYTSTVTVAIAAGP